MHPLLTVEAGTAEAITLDDGYPPTLKGGCREHVAGPGTDDHQVIVGHRWMIGARERSRRVANQAGVPFGLSRWPW
jgi:hypothetical protein